MSNLEKWTKLVEAAQKGECLTDSDTKEIEEGESCDKECKCGEYDCKVCFPDDEELKSEEIKETAYTLTELDDKPAPEGGFSTEIEDDLEDEPLSTFGENPYHQPDVDDLDDPGDFEDDTAPDMTQGFSDEEFGASEDVSELIGEIEYAQDMGISGSSKVYNVDDLINMDAEMVKRIHAKVLGEGLEEDYLEQNEIPAEGGDYGEDPALQWADYFDSDREGAVFEPIDDYGIDGLEDPEELHFDDSSIALSPEGEGFGDEEDELVFIGGEPGTEEGEIQFDLDSEDDNDAVFFANELGEDELSAPPREINIDDEYIERDYGNMNVKDKRGSTKPGELESPPESIRLGEETLRESPEADVLRINKMLNG